ncbi:MAG: M14 family zinc carboxypeptidase [bacterium]|jgi:hypothetical protein|nr:M14 family zinc carboxypeptidase [bacterium]
MARNGKVTYKGKNVVLTTDFDNGGLARIEENEADVFDCWPYDESEYGTDNLFIARSDDSGILDEACFCFHLCVENCKDRAIRLRFHVKEQTRTCGGTLLYANPDFPVCSYDGNTWMRMKNKHLYDDPAMEHGKIVEVEICSADDRMFLSYQYPYSNDHLDRYANAISTSAFCRVEKIGCSTEGRDIKEIVITDEAIPTAGKRIACFIGLQHCAELGAGWGLEGMADFLLSSDPLATAVRQEYIFRIIPMINVDAVSEGRGRIHGTGRNLNREWERSGALSEAASIRASFDAWAAAGEGIDLFIDFHGFSVAEDKNWSFLVMPEGTYKESQAEEYQRLISSLREQLPAAMFTPHEQPGHAAGMAARRYGSLALTVDSYVYRWADEGVIPDLSSYYRYGSEIWSLEDIKACGRLITKALMALA